MVQRFHIVIDARARRASGVGRYIDRLISHLQSVDYDNRYTILVEPDDDWQPTAPTFSRVACRFKQFSLNPIDQFAFAAQLYRLRPNLVHFAMTQQPLFYFGKIVTTTHDLTMFKFVRRGHTFLPVYWLKLWLYRMMMRWSHFKSAKIIVPTQHVREDVMEFQPGTEQKLVVTYEATEPPLKVPAVQPPAISEKDQFLMYVGTAFPHKNLFAMAQAFDIVARKYNKLKLVLVGKKEIHYMELEKRVNKLPNHDRIIFTGFLPDNEVKWLYQHCQAYIFTSLSEGFGLPPLEAMAHGAAVVASNVSCIPEVCGIAAHYFDPHDPEDIAARIQEVLENPTLQKELIKNGKEQVKKFSWQTMTEETFAVYISVLSPTLRQ